MKFSKAALSVAFATIFATSTGYAVQGGEDNNTNCNGVGNPNSPCNPVEDGGQDGQGGQGGTGIGLGFAKSNLVSTNKSNSRATATGFGGNALSSSMGGNVNAKINNQSSNSLVGGDSNSNSTSSVGNINNSSSANGGQSSANSSGNTVTFNESSEVRYSGGYKVKTVGYAIAPSIQPSAGCRKPINAAGGVLGGAFSFGTTFLDENCVRDNRIRLGLLSADPTTNALANEVLQNDLREELEKSKQETEHKSSNYSNIMNY